MIWVGATTSDGFFARCGIVDEICGKAAGEQMCADTISRFSMRYGALARGRIDAGRSPAADVQ
jgi:hypothetical protein